MDTTTAYRLQVNPARAGMILWRDGPRPLRAGKPRASGDDPAISNMSEDLRRVNPARAGMIRLPHIELKRDLRKPRASGDDPRIAELIIKGTM